MAGSEAEFHANVDKFKREFEHTITEEPLLSMIPYQLYHPRIARSFGAVNAGIMQFIEEFSKKEGIFTDPVSLQSF